MSLRRLRHGAIELALWELRGGGGQPLLLLHELGGRSPEAVPAEVASWPGTVWALDFTGHGGSTVPVGGGYTAELLMADADVALAELGPATILGRGLGAYVALLIAGARPREVRGAVLCDGAGLAGGGPKGGEWDLRPAVGEPAPPDPFAIHELSRDARPPGYALLFARQAHHLAAVPDPIGVVATDRPAWLEAALTHPGVVESTLEAALDRFRPLQRP